MYSYVLCSLKSNEINFETFELLYDRYFLLFTFKRDHENTVVRYTIMDNIYSEMRVVVFFFLTIFIM